MQHEEVIHESTDDQRKQERFGARDSYIVRIIYPEVEAVKNDEKRHGDTVN